MKEERSEKIALPKMAELVAERIRGQIARGEFKPGDSLPSETVLMERFGIARPTMREAIRILESESLISTRRGSQSGPKVCDIDVSVLSRRVGLLLQMKGTTESDLHEAQFAIEPRAVALAATRRTKEDLAALRTLIERLRGVVDMDEFASIAAAFHVALVRASKNHTLILVAEVLHALIFELYRTQANLLRPLNKQVVAGAIDLYEKVLARIDARDAEGAEEVWKEDWPVLRASLQRLAQQKDRSLSLYQA